MLKFIKENWFKFIIILILLGCSIFVAYFITTQRSLELSRKCSSDGQKFFDNYKLGKVGYSPKFDEPTYYFNNQLNTCLIAIGYQDSTHESLGRAVWDISHAEIVNIYSNKILISSENPGEDTKFQEQKQLLMSQ